MDIETISHKALRRLVESGNERGLSEVARVRKMIAFLVAAESADDFRVPPNFGAHQLSGDRAGVWSLTVTKNWRMTFEINEDNAIINLDLEDYH